MDNSSESLNLFESKVQYIVKLSETELLPTFMQQRLYMKWVYVVSSVHQSLHTHLGSVCANLCFYKISLK
jgi:hypothetical protein